METYSWKMSSFFDREIKKLEEKHAEIKQQLTLLKKLKQSYHNGIQEKKSDQTPQTNV